MMPWRVNVFYNFLNIIKQAVLLKMLAVYIMKSSNKEDKRLQKNEDAVNTVVANGSNTIKDPDDWTTGDEQMTGAQHSYLTTLSTEAGEEFDEHLTKAEASKKIDELQHKTGRGLEHA
jgi:hypothetical protein